MGNTYEVPTVCQGSNRTLLSFVKAGFFCGIPDMLCDLDRKCTPRGHVLTGWSPAGDAIRRQWELWEETLLGRGRPLRAVPQAMN